MSQSRLFVNQLYKCGFNFFTGVPCTYLAKIIDILSKDKGANYIPATREDSAVGLASGAYLAERWPAVLMQNSGIGCSLNALTSLNLIYKIPVLLIISFRGYKGLDAPEHLVMGKACLKILTDVGIPYLLPDKNFLKRALIRASSEMKRKRIPSAIFIREGYLE